MYMNDKEIKVGEYIRDETGEIFRLTYKELEEETDEIYWYRGDGICTGCYSNQVAKHSSNIIDLIEVGDLIHLIIPPDEYYNKSIETLWYLQDGMLNNTKNSIELKELQLLGIITKQQLALMEYKLDNKMYKKKSRWKNVKKLWKVVRIL